MTIRVLLVDDEAMVRAGLRLILEAETDIVVIGEAADGAQAVDAAAALRPDVVLMDVRMPRLDGLAATQRILAADAAVKVIVVTTFNEDAYLHAALRLGASGFLLKVAPPERLVDAVRVAARGDALLDPLVTRQVIAAFSRTAAEPTATRPRPGFDQLTAREVEALHMLARGLSNAEIAAELVVGDATVKTHVARVLMKLGLRDRVQAVIYAYEHGLVQPTPSTPGQPKITDRAPTLRTRRASVDELRAGPAPSPTTRPRPPHPTRSRPAPPATSSSTPRSDVTTSETDGPA